MHLVEYNSNYKVSSELSIGVSRRDRLHVGRPKEIKCPSRLIYPNKISLQLRLTLENTSTFCAYSGGASPLKNFTLSISGHYCMIGLLICRSIDGSATSSMTKNLLTWLLIL